MRLANSVMTMAVDLTDLRVSVDRQFAEHAHAVSAAGAVDAFGVWRTAP